MLSVMTQATANASFGIYFPKFIGTIYELLSAPVSFLEITIGYVGAAATKALFIGVVILGTSFLFVDLNIEHPIAMLAFLVLTCLSFSLLGFIIGIWAGNFRTAATDPIADHHAARLSWGVVLLRVYAPPDLADDHDV